MTTLTQGFSNWVNAGPREGGQTTHSLKFNSRRALWAVNRGTAVSKCVHWQVVQVRRGDWTEVQERELRKKALGIEIWLAGWLAVDCGRIVFRRFLKLAKLKALEFAGSGSRDFREEFDPTGLFVAA